VPLQTYTAEVARVRDLTHDVREIDLRLIEPATIAFKPGQFVSFEVPKPGAPRPVTRPYSIASAPSRQDQITLLLNLVPGGPGSTYLFSLKEGDRTTFKGPAGTFYLRPQPERDIVMVATGTGIAPFRSMWRAWDESADPNACHVLWGLRSQRDLYYQDELAELAARRPNFRFQITLSRPEAGWTGPVGRVTPLVVTELGPVNRLAAYLCGNSGMIQDVTAVINQRGLCPIYREKYYDDDAHATT